MPRTFTNKIYFVNANVVNKATQEYARETQRSGPNFWAGRAKALSPHLDGDVDVGVDAIGLVPERPVDGP